METPNNQTNQNTQDNQDNQDNQTNTNTLTLLRIKPGEKPEVITIPNTLESLQKEVGGYIETLSISPTALIIVNEEGKIQGLQPNRRFNGDILVGTILITGRYEEDIISLTPEQIALYTKQFETPEDIDPNEITTSFNYFFF